MKLDKIPIANRLQAVETMLDSLSQLHPEMATLARALRYTRSLQRSIVGPRYVKEHSLLRCNQSEARLKKKANWRKVQREREMKQNGTLA